MKGMTGIFSMHSTENDVYIQVSEQAETGLKGEHQYIKKVLEINASGTSQATFF